jgi:hypothetical protein
MFHKDVKITLGRSCATYERGADALEAPICKKVSEKTKLEDQNKDSWMRLMETQGNWE